MFAFNRNKGLNAYDMNDQWLTQILSLDFWEGEEKSVGKEAICERRSRRHKGFLCVFAIWCRYT